MKQSVGRAPEVACITKRVPSETLIANDAPG